MNTATEPSWTLGTLIAFPFGVLCAVAAAVGAVLLWRYHRRNPRDVGVTPMVVVAALIAVTIGVGTGVAMWPWKAEYHQWTPVAGEVEDVNERILSSGDGIRQRFVVTIDGVAYGCDDTRCANIDVGDTVRLLCKPEFQYASVDGYGCRWNDAP